MQRLVIRHRGAESGGGFEVQRVDGRGAKTAPAVPLDDPLSRALPDTAARLGEELVWYLESYLDYPYGPHQNRAERVQAALQCWGEETFTTLSGQGQARDDYRDATRHGHGELQLAIVSDTPRILSWPWEALRDPQVGDLAQHCRIDRQLDSVADPPLPAGLSSERVGILLVTARP